MKQFEIRVDKGARRVFVDGAEVQRARRVWIDIGPGVDSVLSVEAYAEDGREEKQTYALGPSHVVALRILP